ncbi:hypothetical protein GCM10027299_07150 [Larkinella ripae]
MKAVLVIALIGLLGVSELQAQKNGILRIKGGPNWQHSVPMPDRYRYPQFREGKVEYRNGQSAAGRFNYNILIGEMQFIDPKGDTLSLANETLVRSVQLAETGYRYDPKYGFVELLADYSAVRLAFKPIFKTLRAEKNGAYNQSSGTSSITQYKSFIGGSGQLSRLEQEGDLLLEKDVVYLMIDQNNRFYRISKSAVLKLFSKSRSAIEDYLKAESIDFKKEEDLKRLLQFCSTLTS